MATLQNKYWTGKADGVSYSVRLQPYANYTWEPDYSDSQGRLTVSACGIENLDTAMHFSSGSASTVTVALKEGSTTLKSKSYSKGDTELNFGRNGDPYKRNYLNLFGSGSISWLIDKTSSERTLVFSVTGNKSPNTSTADWYGTATSTVSLTLPASSSPSPTPTPTPEPDPDPGIGTLSYSANGGSGAPSRSYFTVGQGFYLSSATPTRSGYQFTGWSYNGATYAPGAYAVFYSTNVTLYAQWEATSADKSLVTFNANGGNPGSVTSKQPGLLSFTFPTASNDFGGGQSPARENYYFLGWSTSPTATTATYEPGQTILWLTTNNVVYYAVWKEASRPMTIVSKTASRVNGASSTTVDDHGQYGLLTCVFTPSQWRGKNDTNFTSVTPSISVYYKRAADANWTLWHTYDTWPVSTAGSPVEFITATNGLNIHPSGGLDTETQYNIRVVISDTDGSGKTHTSGNIETYIATDFYCIDFAPEGDGIGFGMVASTDSYGRGNGFECGMDATFYKEIEAGPSATFGTRFINLIKGLISSLLYPVGSIYMSATMSTTAQVQAAFGGTWVAWGSGKVPVGVNTGDTDFNTVEKTGGSKDAIVVTHSHTLNSHTHTLNSHTHSMSHTHPLNGTGAKASSNGAHTHDVNYNRSQNAAKGTGVYAFSSNDPHSWTTTSAGSHEHSLSGNTGAASSTNTGAASGNTGAASGNTGSQGSSGTGKNLQPYITCYMYKRTA